MKIIFMGTPIFSVSTLKQLLKSNYKISAVVTQPDRPSGRGDKVTPSPVKNVAVAENIELLQPEKANKDRSFIDRVKSIKPDIIIVVAYGQILSEEILSIPEYGCVNLHASLLPKYRGAAPINWVVINGEKITGVTTMKMDKGMDTGDSILKDTVRILPSDTAGTLHDKLSERGAELTVETLKLIENGTAVYVKQNHDKATYVSRLKKEDGLICWDKPACELVNRIKGLVPWPCAFTYLKDNMVKIWDVEIAERDFLENDKRKPGEVTVVNKKALLVATGKGSLWIKEIQFQGRKRLNSENFVCGNLINSGDVFGKLELQNE